MTTGEGERAFSYWIQDAGSTSLRPITLPDSFVELSDVQPVDEDTLLLLGLTLAPASGDVPDVLVDENGMMRTITVWKMELPPYLPTPAIPPGACSAARTAVFWWSFWKTSLLWTGRTANRSPGCIVITGMPMLLQLLPAPP